MSAILLTAGAGMDWKTIGTVAVACIGAAATVLASLVAWRSNRTANKMTTQAQGQSATLESVDRRIGEAFDAKDADRDYLLAELGRRSQQEEVLRERLARLEATFTAYRDQTDARIQEQGEQIAVLSAELNTLRSSDTAWKRWAGAAIGMYATLAERLRRATGEDSPDLPPSPPLT
jgi:hypothetical protein